MSSLVIEQCHFEEQQNSSNLESHNSSSFYVFDWAVVCCFLNGRNGDIKKTCSPFVGSLVVNHVQKGTFALGYFGEHFLRNGKQDCLE